MPNNGKNAKQRENTLPNGFSYGCEVLNRSKHIQMHKGNPAGTTP
jgi:hypothetical protein